MVKSIILPDILKFEWDEANLAHIKRHNVIYQECEEVFYDQPIFFYDEKHSLKEERYGGYGVTKNKRALTLVFTFRGEKIRVVTTRDQHKKERLVYKQSKGGEIEYGKSK